MRRKIDVSASEMRSMREQGMTNQQIAKALDISTQTVYRYIGKRSFDVVNARAQNKPCPVNFAPLDKPDPVEPEETTMDFNTVVKLFEERNKPVTQPSPAPRKTPDGLRIVKETHCYNFEGRYCDYEVDTGAGTVEMFSGEKEAVISGIIDIKTIPGFIEELRAIYAYATTQNHKEAIV